MTTLRQQHRPRGASRSPLVRGYRLAGSARRRVKKPWRATATAVSVVILTMATYWLLPSSVGYPPASPKGSDSLDRQSVAAMLTAPWGGEYYTARLDWSTRIKEGRSSSDLYAIIRSGTARGSLVFGGPITKRIGHCFFNGKPVKPQPGTPALGFEVPDDAVFWLRGRDDESVSHIDFAGDSSPGDTVLRCDLEGFASDDPPIHRLYTPELVAYAEGSDRATDEQLRLQPVCVKSSMAVEEENGERCAEAYQPVANLPQRDDLVTKPEEQGIRDSRLILVGALAGTAASLLPGLVVTAAGVIEPYWRRQRWRMGIRHRTRRR